VEFRTDINGLRAIAVISVVLYHFGIAGFSGGFIGVDIFFVISGYLMTKIIITDLEANKFSLISFYLSRARRIVPALAVLCGVMLAFGWIALAPIDYQNLAKEIYASLGYFSNIVYLREAGYFDVASHEKWLLHTWSLSVEWQFYLLYPIYMLVIVRTFKGALPVALSIWAAFLVSLALSIFVTSLKPIVAFYLLPTRAWEMLAGGLVFVHDANINRLKLKKGPFEFLGLLLILISAISFNAYVEWPGYLALAPVTGAVLVILSAKRSSVLTGNKIFQFIGQCSYSIYLWHWPVIAFIKYFEGQFNGILVAAAICLSVVLGWLSFYFVEQPLRRTMQKLTTIQQVVSFAFGALSLLLVAIAVNVSDGVNWRYRGNNLVQLLQYGEAIGDWDYPSNCGRMDIFGRLRLCKIRGKGKHSVLFIGDSEVEQWWPKLHELPSPNLRRHEIVLATYGGCPPLPEINRYTPGYRCDQFFDAARHLAFNQEYSTVVFGSVWTDYFYGAYNSKDPEPALFAYDQNHKRVPVTLRSPVFKNVISEFARFISRLVKSGKRVIIILPIPGRSENIPKVLYLATWRGTPIPDLSIRKNDFRRYARPLISKLRQIAADTGAEIIDPLDYLCSDDRCPVLTRDGIPLYKDGAHLRPFAVKARAGFLDDLLTDKTSERENAPRRALR
jgi:peptidoglycan/LPS O-acetylase OafA/YrhL